MGGYDYTSAERQRRYIARLKEAAARAQTGTADTVSDGASKIAASPDLAAKLDPLLDAIFEMILREPATYCAPTGDLIRLERILVDAGIMPGSRRTNDAIKYARELKAKHQAHLARAFEASSREHAAKMAERERDDRPSETEIRAVKHAHAAGMFPIARKWTMKEPELPDDWRIPDIGKATEPADDHVTEPAVEPTTRSEGGYAPLRAHRLDELAAELKPLWLQAGARTNAPENPQIGTLLKEAKRVITAECGPRPIRKRSYDAWKKHTKTWEDRRDRKWDDFCQRVHPLFTNRQGNSYIKKFADK